MIQLKPVRLRARVCQGRSAPVARPRLKVVFLDRQLAAAWGTWYVEMMDHFDSHGTMPHFLIIKRHHSGMSGTILGKDLGKEFVPPIFPE
jgi:hypothetical protein